jgi:hypothetical protein
MMPVVDELVPVLAPPAPLLVAPLVIIPLPAEPPVLKRDVFSSPPQPPIAHANAKTHPQNHVVFICIILPTLLGKARFAWSKEIGCCLWQQRAETIPLVPFPITASDSRKLRPGQASPTSTSHC